MTIHGSFSCLKLFQFIYIIPNAMVASFSTYLSIYYLVEGGIFVGMNADGPSFLPFKGHCEFVFPFFSAYFICFFSLIIHHSLCSIYCMFYLLYFLVCVALIMASLMQPLPPLIFSKNINFCFFAFSGF